MKFSVLIAHYNNAHYFKDCYDSLLEQTYQNWEAIILDDVSTNNSYQEIEKIISEDHRFKLFRNDKNQGVGFTKRRLVELAQGDICAFLDPDDALFSNAIEDSVEELIKNKKLVATYSQLTICDDKLSPIKIQEKIKQVLNNKLFFNTPMQMSHFFSFRKERYLKTSGINPALRSAVDQDLYLKLLEQGSAKFIPKEMYKYRLHSSGVSQDKSKTSAKENFAKVILETMHRRDLKEINGKKIPDNFTNSQEIYQLLEYQNSLWYRLLNRIKLFFNSI